MSIFNSLSIGVSALQSYLRALQVTSHNVANANTPGFSRQRVILAQNNAIDIGNSRLPTGVSIAQIQRVIDPALFLSIQKKLNQLGSATVYKNAFSRIEGFTSEIQGKGIIENLRNFFTSVANFASDTNNTSLKNLVISNGQILLDSLKTYTQNLDTLLHNFQDTLPDKVNFLNTKLDELANLNQTIVQIEKAGTQSETANDLRDKREQIVKDISNLMNISTLEDQYGNLNVSINGELLVNGKEVNKLKVIEEIQQGEIVKKIQTVNTNGNIKPVSGELGAVFNLTSTIKSIKSDLELIFRGLVFEFNKLHSVGAGKEIFTSLSSKFIFSESAKTDPLSQQINVDAKSKSQIQVNSLIGSPDGSFKDYYIIKETKSGGQVVAKVSDFFGATGTITTDRKIDVNIGDKFLLSATPFSIKNGSFDVLAVDTINNTQKVMNIPVDLDNIGINMSLTDLVTSMNTIFTANSIPFTASITSDNQLNITSTNDQIKFYFKNDTSNILSAIQINSFFTGSSLPDFDVNSNVKNNLNLITYAQDFLNQDNKVALNLSQLHKQVIFDTGEGMEAKLINFFGNLASDIDKANTNFELQNDLTIQLETEREKISGVNLEEEAANLILYQKAFTANAKFIQSINQVFDTLLSII